jgi:hypothetical protein
VLHALADVGAVIGGLLGEDAGPDAGLLGDISCEVTGGGEVAGG